MSDDFITVSAGAPQVDIQPGVYPVVLVEISEPRTIFPQSGPNAGKEVTLRDWTFHLEDETEIRGSASTASGPKSKTYAWLTALLGGTPPQVGQSYPKEQLVGRWALATVAIDDGGWPKITNLSAMPRSLGQAPQAVAPAPQAVPAAAPAPASRRAQPVAAAAPVATAPAPHPQSPAGDQLPF